VDGRNEFIGEDRIDHTPKDETVRLYTGNAFDLIGERRQTDFRLDTNKHWAEETFEIKVRNHKKEKVEVRVVEHMYRWIQWEMKSKSMPYKKTDARTIEFRPEGSRQRRGRHHLYGPLFLVSRPRWGICRFRSP
jgi:hypothetical protein